MGRLVDFVTDMASGPVCAMVWEGREVVKTGRMLLGATNPLASQPGTIRGDFAIVSSIFTSELSRSEAMLIHDSSRTSDETSATVPMV